MLGWMGLRRWGTPGLELQFRLQLLPTSEPSTAPYSSQLKHQTRCKNAKQNIELAVVGDLRDFWLQIVKKLLRSWAECQQHKARNLKLFGTEFCPEMFAPNSFADAMKSVGEDQVRRTHL